jgi:hypothetical protein
MTNKKLWGAGAAVIVAVVAAVVIASGSTDLRAQSSADTLASLLQDLDASGTRATLEFGQAVPRLGRSVDIGEGAVLVDRIGADIICFVIPGTTLDQISCVPFANVMSVIYSQR